MKTNGKSNDTMPSSTGYFDYGLISPNSRRISGSNNLNDAIETVGRKYVRSKKGHRAEGVLIYGQTTCGVTSDDYRILSIGDELDESKHLFVIINSLHFHLCFLILHIDAGTWTKRLFQDLLNLGETKTISYFTLFKNRIDDRRRSKPLVRFAEQCVTQLTPEIQDNLLVLNNLPTGEDKIRAVYLVLKNGWDYVLHPDFMTNDLPRICKMTVVEFKTEHVVDVDVIIERSATPYGQYFDELKQDRKLFERNAKGVGEMIRMVANKENSNDNNGDDNDKDDGDLSISSSTNNKTGKRKREENNNGDDDGVDNNNSNTNNNDTATRSYRENPSERSSSRSDEEKQKKKKKKKKKTKKKKKKKISTDDSDDDATIVSPTKKTKRSDNENGFFDDDSNYNNKKSFRPEKDNSESNEEDEISDAGDTNFVFGDDFSMVRILVSLCRWFYNILFIGFTYIPFY